jgi:hypothetical protein
MKIYITWSSIIHSAAFYFLPLCFIFTLNLKPYWWIYQKVRKISHWKRQIYSFALYDLLASPHSFVSSALPQYPWIGGWVFRRAGLVTSRKKNLLSLPEIESLFDGRPGRTLVPTCILFTLSRLRVFHSSRRTCNFKLCSLLLACDRFF